MKMWDRKKRWNVSIQSYKMKKVFLKRKHPKRKDSLMNRHLISRALAALALMFTLGLVTIAAAAPSASAHAQTPTVSAQANGTFNIVLKKVNLVAKGKTIGYLEALTDGQGNKELHGHLYALPAGSTGQSYLLLEAENDDYAASNWFSTAPQDIYLSEVPSYSISIPTYFDIVNINTNVTYQTSF
jgi:hypothetical protein